MSCSDGKQNGNEVGTDCGGPNCPETCEKKSVEAAVHAPLCAVTRKLLRYLHVCVLWCGGGGADTVTGWLLYVYVFHSLANLPVRVNCFLEASERTLSSIVLAYCCTRLRQRLCWSIPPCVCARACCCHCR